MINWERHWYRSSLDFFSFLLLPFSFLFFCLVTLRRFLYKIKFFRSYRFSVPVVVVGNITIGGTGKTPFVIALSQLLKEKNFRPGIVSRGVGGKQQKKPRWVTASSDVKEVGDEALLLATRSECPVVIGIDRVAAVKELLAKTDCNVVLSDDGLQHYRLERDVEIAIMDAARGVGNGCLLPAGPLREMPARLRDVDFFIWQTENRERKKPHSFYLSGDLLVSVASSLEKIQVEEWKGRKVHAVAGIGNPQRFFHFLREKGLEVVEHVFPDHYAYREEDLRWDDGMPVVMTEKDAVKCRDFSRGNLWCLPVGADLDGAFCEMVLYKLLK